MSEIRLLTTVTVDRARIAEFRELMVEAAADSLSEVDDAAHGHLGYGVFLDEERSEVLLYEHHASFEDFVAHLSVNPSRRARMRELCSPGRTIVLGPPPEELVDALDAMGIERSVYASELGVRGLL